MANKQISQIDNAVQALADADVAVIEQDTGGGVWVTGKITLLAIYTWIASKLAAAGLTIPVGGTTGQVLAKASGSDGDTAWADTVPTDANGNPLLTLDASPPTPSAGQVAIFGAPLGALAVPAWINAEGRQYLPQIALATRSWGAIIYSYGTTTPTTIGPSLTLSPGTVTAGSTGTGVMASPYVKLTSSASAGNSVEGRYAALHLSAGAGYLARWIWSPQDAAAVADSRSFCGLTGGAGVLGNIDPINLTNCVGIGHSPGDTTLQVYHNDGSGTATKTAVAGSGWDPSDTSAVYELILYCPAGASAVQWRLRNTITDEIAVGEITSDLPATSQFLTHHYWRGNGATASAVALHVYGFFFERGW